MKKLKSENQILVMVALFSISIGLWENFRQLWLQDNGFSAMKISNITSLGTFVSVLGILFVGRKITIDKLKGFMSVLMVIKFINLVAMYYLNYTNIIVLINIATVIDVLTSYLIITSIYPLITTIVKNNTIYSKRKLTEYLFKDLGILVGGLLIGKKVIGVLVNYNVCLYISIVFLVATIIVMFNIDAGKTEKEEKTKQGSVVKYVLNNKLLIGYTLYTFIGCIAMQTGLGLKMLTLTNYFEFSDGGATNYFLIVGLIADGIGILALKYLTPKNDYITITIKFGIRFTLYVIAFLSNSLIITIIAITWSILISTAYENICDGYYINSVSNEYQLTFTNFRYIVKYIGEAIGLFLCGVMYEMGLRYMFGLSAFFMIFQIIVSFWLIHTRHNMPEEKTQK